MYNNGVGKKSRGADGSTDTHLRQILHAAEHFVVLGIRPKLDAKATVLHDDFTNLQRSRAELDSGCDESRSVRIGVVVSGFEVKGSEHVQPS
jgi:hypothetical protein